MARRLVACVILLGCLAGTAFAATGSDPRDPKKRHNDADQAWAEAIRIGRSDLGQGDWRVEQLSTDDDRGAPTQCRNPNLSDLVETGSAKEPDFSRNGSFVGSGSIVFLNARQLRTAWNRMMSQPITQCLIDGFKRGLAGSGAKLRIVSAGPVRMPKLAPLFKTGRVGVLLSGGGKQIKGRLSYYYAARGRASAVLVVASFGAPLTPIPESLERKLATLVAKRLQK
jgi:hypothetical protein